MAPMIEVTESSYSPIRQARRQMFKRQKRTGGLFGGGGKQGDEGQKQGGDHRAADNGDARLVTQVDDVPDAPRGRVSSSRSRERW